MVSINLFGFGKKRLRECERYTLCPQCVKCVRMDMTAAVMVDGACEDLIFSYRSIIISFIPLAYAINCNGHENLHVFI